MGDGGGVGGGGWNVIKNGRATHSTKPCRFSSSLDSAVTAMICERGLDGSCRSIDRISAQAWYPSIRGMLMSRSTVE